MSQGEYLVAEKTGHFDSFVANSYAAKVIAILNKIFLVIFVTVTTTRRGGIIKSRGRCD